MTTQLAISDQLSNALDQLGNNSDVTYNEVSAVFIGRYEDSLYAKKDDLQKQLITAKKDLANHTKYVEGLVDMSVLKEGYTAPFFRPSPNKTPSVTVHWEERFNVVKNSIAVDIVVVVDRGLVEDQTFTISHVSPIPDEEVQHHEHLIHERDKITSELEGVLSDIKGIGRKQRQLAARLAELKLNAAGLDALLTDDIMNQLVEVK